MWYTHQQFKIPTYRLRRCFSSGWTADSRHALDGGEGSADGLPLPVTFVLAVSPIRSRPVSCEICIGASSIRTCFSPMTSVFPPCHCHSTSVLYSYFIHLSPTTYGMMLVMTVPINNLCLPLFASVVPTENREKMGTLLERVLTWSAKIYRRCDRGFWEGHIRKYVHIPVVPCIKHTI